MEVFRDTAFGHLVRLITKTKFRQLQYQEEYDSDVWQKYNTGEVPQTPEAHRQTETWEDGYKSGNYDSEIDSINCQRPLSESSFRTLVPGSHEDFELTSRTRDDIEEGKDVHLVKFLPNDPEDPQNWPLTKKVLVTFQICLLTTGIYFGSSIYSAGLLDVMRVFHVGQVEALLGLTLFVAGYGMIWSPLSEIPYLGRNPIYIGTLFLFVVLQFPTAMSVNFGMLLAFRFLSGFVGSPVLATGGATLVDIWSPQKRAYAIGIWGVAAGSGPTLGPLIGGFVAMEKGWRWPIWELMWFGGFAFLVLFFFLPETSASNILYRRTKRLRKLTGNSKLICESERAVLSMSGKDVVKMTLIRPFTLNFTEPMVFLLNLYIALVYGLLYIWFESFPLVFGEVYHFNIGLQGLTFLGILMGSLVALMPYFWYMHNYVEPQFDGNGDIQPEKRLPPAFVGAFCIPICLFWFGWTARTDVHWIIPIIGSGFFSVGTVLLFNPVLNYLPDAYPSTAASVLAGNDLFRSSFGSGFPLFANALYNRLGINWASSLLAFIAILFIPIPFVLYKVGAKLRKNYSKHARKD
ncbi:Caffeine resistance protein 5 [Colletotrichum chlorophyti]|uniref:Caffeine resistance protein 5 n=1 Tax=Colletotrichum chlorophyti TaxID=708187 RepID=A0A1Q8RXV3_9PEZI|nr:Caffeine resistance protein 5 [Colletotrichum chlorophyti]